MTIKKGTRWLVVTWAALSLSGCSLFDDDALPSTPPGATGTVTFDFVPTLVSGDTVKLDFAHTVQMPARFVVVEALDAASSAVLASSVTDATGHYAIELSAGTSARIQAKARMPKGAGNSLAVSVLDNTAANAQWATIGPAFVTDQSGASIQNLRAGSGWTGTAYNDSQRAAGPFAILDTLYTAEQKVVSVDPGAAFPPLTVYWSPNNVSAGTGDDPSQIAIGQILITHFSPPDAAKGTGHVLYVLGKADNDTDEYDRHVIAHEFGHYLQSAFSRDDNIGGGHELGDLLDIRTAFSEGWGNGWSGIALDDPIYTDTLDVSQSKGDAFDVSAGAASNPGFFSEASIQKVFWDFSKEPAIGFASVWATLKTGLTQAPALSSIHAFSFSLKTQVPGASAAVAAILSTQAIVLPADVYGTGELFFGLPEVQDLQPLYVVHPGVGSDLPAVCVNNSRAPAAASGRERNRAGEWRFLRIAALAAGPRTFTVTTTSSVNSKSTPAMSLYDKTGDIADTDDKGVNTQTLTKTLRGGDYVLAVSDLQLGDAAAARTCFTVRID